MDSYFDPRCVKRPTSLGGVPVTVFSLPGVDIDNILNDPRLPKIIINESKGYRLDGYAIVVTHYIKSGYIVVKVRGTRNPGYKPNVGDEQDNIMFHITGTFANWDRFVKLVQGGDLAPKRAPRSQNPRQLSSSVCRCLFQE